MTRQEMIRGLNRILAEYEYELDQIDREVLNMAIKALEKEQSEDCISRANWLHEAIRCEVLCTNHMRSDMGCDGGCQYDTDLLKRIDKVIDKVIGDAPSVVLQVPSEDCISRQAAIEAITMKREDCITREVAIDIIKHYDFEFPEYMKRFVNELRDAMKKDLVEDITNAPSVVPSRETGKWIPVSERLPEDGYWLWSATSGEVKKDFYWEGHWELAEKFGYEVVAWMPLPEPYRESEERQ